MDKRIAAKAAPTRTEALFGVVLAGGRSERMGRDKALLVYDGEALLARAHRVLAEACARVVVAVRADQAAAAPYAGFDVVVDVARVGGPAAGLLAAARAHPNRALLALAVDMPLVDERVLGALVAARDPAAAATAFEHADGTVEPLCAIWEPAALDRVRASAQNSSVSLRRVLEGAGIRRIAAPGAACIRSVNTPEDYAALRGSPEL